MIFYIEYILTNSLVIGFLVFIISYTTIFLWHINGFDTMELSLMSIISGIYFFIIVIVSNIFYLNKGIKNCNLNSIKYMKRIYQVLLTLIISYLTYLILDYVFFLIDDSMSRDFAIGLKNFAESNNKNLDGIDEFVNLSFGIQNSIVTFVFGLLGSLISLIFITKSGDLFKSKSSDII